MSRFGKRFAVMAFDAAALLVCACIVSFGFTEPAYAYVDPSVMTYTIQALAGVAVALSAVAGVAFRRTRRALLKALNIDENAHKDVEAEVHRMDENGAVIANAYESVASNRAASASATSASARKTSGTTGSLELSWVKRFACSLIVAVFCGMTLGITAPFETVAGAPNDLHFGLEDIAWIMALFTGGCALVLALVLSLFRGKWFHYALTLTFCVGLCCYVQAMFLNDGMPVSDGRPVDWWGTYRLMMILSSVVWLALVVGPLIACHFKPREIRAGALVLSVALTIVQGVGVASLMVSDYGAHTVQQDGPTYITEDGLFEVSPKSNVVVFILDMYDTRDAVAALEQDPNMFENLDGFVWYQDSVGMILPTKYAIPYLLTGQMIESGDNVPQYLVDRYEDGKFLRDLSSTGYSVGVYSDTLELAFLTDDQAKQDVYQYVDNAHGLMHREISKRGTIRSLSKCALYRDAPWPLKFLFRFYSDDVNQACISMEPGDAPDQTLWVTDDVAYYNKLVDRGLTAVDDGSTGAFRFIHLKGPHWPYNMDEECRDLGEDGSTRVQQARGSIKIVDTYLDEMRRLGVYEDSAIIITADHGDWVSSRDLPEDVTSPLMLVKPAGASGEPLRISDAKTGHVDMLPFILREAGYANYQEYGIAFDEVDDPNRVRDSFQITSSDGHVWDIVRYSIQGNVLDFSSWVFTGERWDAEEAEH